MFNLTSIVDTSFYDETEIYDDNDNKIEVEWFVDRYFDSYESYEDFLDELSSRYQ